MSQKVIIIGASSGIGRSLAKVYAREGWQVGVTARREELLLDLKREVNRDLYVRRMDLKNISEAMKTLETLIAEMGGLDVIIINAGVNHYTRDFEWEKDYDTMFVNVAGFMGMVNVAAKYFLRQGRGHIAGISSIAGVRGSGRAPVYCATKAFVTNYLEGLEHELGPKGISITDIRPGFVDTEMIRKSNVHFWVASPDDAAADIYQCIQSKKKSVYVTRRWTLVAWIQRLLPRFVYTWLIRKSMKN